MQFRVQLEPAGLAAEIGSHNNLPAALGWPAEKCHLKAICVVMLGAALLFAAMFTLPDELGRWAMEV